MKKKQKKLERDIKIISNKKGILKQMFTFCEVFMFLKFNNKHIESSTKKELIIMATHWKLTFFQMFLN